MHILYVGVVQARPNDCARGRAQNTIINPQRACAMLRQCVCLLPRDTIGDNVDFAKKVLAYHRCHLDKLQ